MGLIERAEAYRLLQSRTRRSVDKQIGMMRGTRQCLMPTALAANDPGYDDTQEWRACVDAGEGSAALLAALARWHPERISA